MYLQEQSCTVFTYMLNVPSSILGKFILDPDRAVIIVKENCFLTSSYTRTCFRICIGRNVGNGVFAFTPGKKSRYPSCRRLGGLQGQSGRVRKISPPHRDSITGPTSP